MAKTTKARESSTRRKSKQDIGHDDRPSRARFTVLMREDLMERLRDVAVHEYRTLSDIAEEAFSAYLKKAGKVPKRRTKVRTGRPIGPVE